MTEYVANALAASATSAIAGLLCATAACASKHANDDAVKEPTTTAELFFSDDAAAFPFPSAPTLPPLVFAATATRRPLTFNLLTFFCALALVVVVCESNKAGEDDIIVVIIILLDITEKEMEFEDTQFFFSYSADEKYTHTQPAKYVVKAARSREGQQKRTRRERGSSKNALSLTRTTTTTTTTTPPPGRSSFPALLLPLEVRLFWQLLLLLLPLRGWEAMPTTFRSFEATRWVNLDMAVGT
jgi:hypothetical protein